MARCVEQRDIDLTDAQHVAGTVFDQMIGADLGGFPDPLGFVSLDVDGAVDLVPKTLFCSTVQTLQMTVLETGQTAPSLEQ